MILWRFIFCLHLIVPVLLLYEMFIWNNRACKGWNELNLGKRIKYGRLVKQRRLYLYVSFVDIVVFCISNINAGWSVNMEHV
jgi:hypothetical protein